MIHIYDRDNQYVASINQQNKLAAGYVKEEPWLLLRKTGRTDRFATKAEARDEAKKSWAACSFRRT